MDTHTRARYRDVRMCAHGYARVRSRTHTSTRTGAIYTYIARDRNRYEEQRERARARARAGFAFVRALPRGEGPRANGGEERVARAREHRENRETRSARVGRERGEATRDHERVGRASAAAIAPLRTLHGTRPVALPFRAGGKDRERRSLAGWSRGEGGPRGDEIQAFTHVRCAFCRVAVKRDAPRIGNEPARSSASRWKVVRNGGYVVPLPPSRASLQHISLLARSIGAPAARNRWST